jgi:selenocysteine-specific elongation factor
METEIRAAAGKLAGEKRLRLLSERPLKIAAFELVEECVAAIRAQVEDFHRANPLAAGIPKQELRGRVGGPDAELFEVALDDAIRARGITVSGDLVQRAGREIELTPEEARAKEIIEAEFEKAGLRVPSFSAVVRKLPVEARRAQKILQILLREQVLIKVAEDLAFHRAAVQKLRDLIRAYKQRNGTRLPVPAFKELTGVTRKYAIPLLEYLDREHVTRRVGDERVIL